MRVHLRRNHLRPFSVCTALLCLVLCLLAAPARAQITYAHMLYDDKIQGFWKDGSWRADVDPDLSLIHI